MGNIGHQKEVEEALASYSTPFKVLNTAEQNVQFTISPEQGLTRRRYQWYSNGTLFDQTHFDDTVEAGIQLSTGTSGSDQARIKSGIVGQYVSQALAKPGLGMFIPEEFTELNSDNEVSLTHGEVYAGAFWWDDVNDEVETGVGFKWSTNGWEFFVKSLGDHIGDSPVPQSEFNIDSFDGDGLSGQIHDPPIGYVYNFPYTWYNEGPFEAGYLSKTENQFEEALRFSTDGPSTDTPNFPIQLVVRNAGDTQSLTAELGGMQYSTYGGSVDDIEFRETDETRLTAGQQYIDLAKATSENAVDPSAEAGRPLVSIQRESDNRGLAVAIQQIDARVSNDNIYIYQWDEPNPSSALTNESFTDPVTPNNDSLESNLLTDTQATDYTPSSDAILRSLRYFEGGDRNKVGSTVTQRVDARVSTDVTRVITAVNDCNANADVDPIIVKIEESF